MLRKKDEDVLREVYYTMSCAQFIMHWTFPLCKNFAASFSLRTCSNKWSFD